MFDYRPDTTKWRTKANCLSRLLSGLDLPDVAIFPIIFYLVVSLI